MAEASTSISLSLDPYYASIIQNNKRASPSPSKVQRGLVAWMKAFWLPLQQRKHPLLRFEFSAQTDELKIDSLVVTSNGEHPVVVGLKDRPFWEKQVSQSLKKIDVEDLGDMNATELWNTIPDNDGHGRGKLDLERMQKELSVKVVFLESHVLLVGPKQKLTKKCFILRNVLSHYHWRLSGKDSSQSAMGHG